MKKIIVTLCSLALLVSGGTAGYQLIGNNEKEVKLTANQYNNIENEVKALEQNLLAAESTQADNTAKQSVLETTDEDTPALAKKEKAESKIEETPNKKNNITDAAATKTEDTKKTQKSSVNTVKKASVTKNTKAVKNTVTTKNTNVNKDTNSDKNATVNKNTISVIEKKASDVLKQNNNQTYVYRNINFSQCSDPQKIMELLKQYDCTNLTDNQLKSITTPEELLNLILTGSKDKKSSSNGNNNSNSNNSSNGSNNNSNVNNGSNSNNNTSGNSNSNGSNNNTNGNNGSNSNNNTNGNTNSNSNNGSNGSNNSSNSTGISAYAAEVLRLVNQERAKAGLSAFTTNATLASAADKRAQETVQSFSHTRPDGRSFSTVFGEYGITYRAAGENIAYGQRTPQEVVNGWMNSPGHRANILNAKFNKIGIGVYQRNSTIYWSQLFTD